MFSYSRSEVQSLHGNNFNSMTAGIRLISLYVNIFVLLPVQVIPSPVYPGSQRQAKDPLVLLQYA